MKKTTTTTKNVEDVKTLPFARSLGDGWVVRYEFAPDRDGVLVVSRLVLEPQTDAVPAAGINSEVLGRVRVRAARSYARTLAPPAAVPKKEKKKGRGGRPPLKSSFYQRVYKRYMELLRAGDAESIGRTLADEFDYTHDAMRSLLKRGRRYGFFNQTLQAGPAVGLPWPKTLKKTKKARERRASAHLPRP